MERHHRQYLTGYFFKGELLVRHGEIPSGHLQAGSKRATLGQIRSDRGDVDMSAEVGGP